MPSTPPGGRNSATEVGNQDKRPKTPEAESDNGNLKFRCPFPAQDPDRYKEVHKHCRADHSYRTIGRLNEHIRRYHSLRYWCTVCKTNFSKSSEKSIDHDKRAHDKDCQPKTWSEEEELASHTYMTEEQQNSWGDGRWKNVSIQGKKGDPITKRNWKKIYKSLFPGDTQSPSHYHDSELSSRIEASITVSSISTTIQDGTTTGQDGMTTPGDVINPVNGGNSPGRDKDDPHIISGKRKATSEPDTDRLFTTNSKSGSGFTATEETASEVTATNALELDRGEQSPGTVDNFHPIFANPWSGDLSLIQIKQRPAELDQAVWDDDPGLMVNSHTSETAPSQPQSSSADQTIIAHFLYPHGTDDAGAEILFAHAGPEVSLDDADPEVVFDGETKPDGSEDWKEWIHETH